MSGNRPGEKQIEFELELHDGRVARCWQASAQEYLNCTISAGLVEGIEPDTFYLRFERDDNEPMTIFSRTDELLAIIYVCSGAVWSAEMIERDELHSD